MENKYLMAIDAGTGSIRSVLFDLKGNQIECSQIEWEHLSDPRYPGSMNFDWEKNWQLTCDCIQNTLKKSGIDPKLIAGISTTCMREGIILYNSDGKEIWACANVDSRSNDQVSKLIDMNPLMEREIYKKTGETYALGALPRLLWVKENMPEIYNNIKYVGMFNDWLIYQLTGILAVEPSNGSTTGILDLKSRQWDTEIAKQCHISEDIFPQIAECGTVVGKVTEKSAGKTGLSIGTPVIAGGGDAQLGCLGVGAIHQGQGTVLGGSFWQYELNVDSPKVDPNCRIRVNCHALPNRWQYEAIAFQPGIVMRWYRDAFCQEEIAESKKTGIDTYEILNEKAKKIPPGAYGMQCTFSDVMNFIHWKHASPTFTNFALDAEKFNKYTFYRSIMENACLITKGHLESVKESTGLMPEKMIFAGGASKSTLWCQILSDVLGMIVEVPVTKEATALGAAILAGVGTGLFKDVDEAVEAMVTIEKIYYPDEKRNQMYQRHYEQWRKVYKAQLDLCNQNLTSSMWTAPGI